MNKFGKVLGILALVIAGISVFIPGGALLATILGAPLIVFSWKEGAIFGYIAGGLNIINISFLSPTVWLAMAAAEGLDGNGLSTGVYLVVVQVIAMAIMGFITWKSDKNSSTKKTKK
tara:strand:+ start:1459 stop:1809 length:351 start_codon:yes stop_codon:yes gene_type:complete